MIGDVQDEAAPLSRWQLNALPGSLEENLNCAEVRLVGDFGPLVIEATGATVSIVHVQVADPVFPDSSTVVIFSVCWPLVRPL